MSRHTAFVVVPVPILTPDKEIAKKRCESHARPRRSVLVVSYARAFVPVQEGTRGFRRAAAHLLLFRNMRILTQTSPRVRVRSKSDIPPIVVGRSNAPWREEIETSAGLSAIDTRTTSFHSRHARVALRVADAVLLHTGPTSARSTRAADVLRRNREIRDAIFFPSFPSSSTNERRCDTVMRILEQR